MRYHFASPSGHNGMRVLTVDPPVNMPTEQCAGLEATATCINPEQGGLRFVFEFHSVNAGIRSKLFETHPWVIFSARNEYLAVLTGQPQTNMCCINNHAHLDVALAFTC